MNKKMKHFLLPLFLGVSCLSSYSMADTIATINTSTLFKNHPKFEEVKKMLDDTFYKFQEEINKDKQHILELEKDINNKKLKRDEVNKKKKELDMLKDLLKAKAQKMSEQRSEIENQKRIEILQDIQENSIEYAKKNNVDVIIDSGSVVFIKTNKDLTEDILKYIKEKQMKK